MKIEKVTYGPWREAYRCVYNSLEMVVVTEIGPRIMSFKMMGGTNILFEDTVGISLGNWKIYGGNRMWLAPETAQTYLPDNDPCETAIDGNILRVAQRPDPNGLQKIMEVAPDRETGGFIVRYILRNIGNMLSTGAMWMLTCVVPTRVVTPWGSGSEQWHTNMARYWRNWAGQTSNVASPQWKPNNDYFLIEPTGEVGKVGLFSEEGFLAALRPESTFIKTYQPFVGVQFPDGGCNIELYTCKHFMEMETLSPIYTFYPGREHVHTERWILTDRTFEPDQWQQMREFLPKRAPAFI